MNSATVIRDVSLSLKDFLLKNISELNREDSVLLDSPADIENPSRPTLLMYLFHIARNPHLLDDPPEIPPGGDLTGTIIPAPYPADLYYMFVPYAQNRETELILMDRLIHLFYFHAQLIVENLSTQATTEDNVVRIFPYSMPMEELGRLWASFPGRPYKLSQFYMVTPVFLPAPEASFQRVQQVETQIGLLDGERKADYVDRFRLGGAESGET